MPDLSELVTVSEAAKIKGVPADTVRRRIARQRLRATRKGNQWLIERKELDAWVVRETRKSPAADVSALDRAAQIHAMQQRLAAAAPSVERYLELKHEEIAQERRREQARNAGRP